VEAYVPIRRDFGNEDGQNPDEFLKSILYRGGIVPGGLKTRQPNSQRLAVQSDVAAMQSHITEMEYFIAYAEKVSTLNQVFSGENNKVMNLIKDKYGRVAVDTIKGDLGWFANRGVIMSHAGEQFFTRLMRNYGFAQLGAKPQIGLKQLASFSAMAADVKTKDFVAGLVKLSTNPAKAWRTMNKSTFFAERGMNIDNDFRELRADAFNGKLLNFMGRNPSFTKVMMTAIRFGDKGAIFLGGYAHVHAKMKEGFTEEQALDSMARLANKTQQSSDPDQTTQLQRSTAPAILRILGQFMSSANAVTRAELEAIHEFRKGRLGTGEFAKRILIHHLIIPNLIMFLTNGLSWDDEDQLFASILGSFNGLLILGDVIEYAVASAMDMDQPFEPDGRHPLELANGLIEAITGDWDDVSFEDIIEGSKTIERLLKFGGDLTGIPSNTLFNMLRGIVLFADDEYEEGAGLMMGYSPYILEKNK